MPNQLQINTDYGAAFGLSAEKGQALIYCGGDTWIARQIRDGQTVDKQISSPKTTASALEYINRPVVRMGDKL